MGHNRNVWCQSDLHVDGRRRGTHGIVHLQFEPVRRDRHCLPGYPDACDLRQGCEQLRLRRLDITLHHAHVVLRSGAHRSVLAYMRE